ncbi:helix-turn-helix domain-containing protein [Intrasporangium flavum]|uniref:helix-turn-helix domain-containing protein n=1 Tax=Intrasporangium flavum TaxID=1428657 RepID=UPI00096D85D0|nr:helix-turn-helix domain-containing protein [Intrasporangium flavum]
MSTKPPTHLLTAHEVAARLGEHIKTTRKRTRRGDFASFAINLGTQNRPIWRYDERLLERWIDSRRAA